MWAKMRARYGHDSHVKNTHGGLGGLKSSSEYLSNVKKQLGVRKVLYGYPGGYFEVPRSTI
jgi:hypothetical protein